MTALGFYVVALTTKTAAAQFVSVSPGVVVGGWGWRGPCWGNGRFFFRDARFFHDGRFFRGGLGGPGFDRASRSAAAAHPVRQATSPSHPLS